MPHFFRCYIPIFLKHYVICTLKSLHISILKYFSVTVHFFSRTLHVKMLPGFSFTEHHFSELFTLKFQNIPCFKIFYVDSFHNKRPKHFKLPELLMFCNLPQHNAEIFQISNYFYSEIFYKEM